MFKGVCEMVNQTIPNFTNCFRCDTAQNVFLARTQHIKDIGGWDPELMIIEHKDIFIRLKAAQMKLVFCKDVQLWHWRPRKGTSEQGEGYLEKRRRGGERFKFLLFNRWNIQDIFERGTDHVRIDNAGNITYLDQQQWGHC